MVIKSFESASTLSGKAMLGLKENRTHNGRRKDTMMAQQRESEASTAAPDESLGAYRNTATIGGHHS